VELEHLRDVHLVDVVGAEDEDLVGVLVGDQVQVLKDRVDRALVPITTRAHLRGHRLAEVTEEGRHAPRARDVIVERVRLVLRQHLELEDARVDEVREAEVDDAIAATERDGGLRALSGEGVKARTSATSQHHRECSGSHVLRC
jgi:hypothetical protein